MDAPATEFYRLCDSAIELANKKDYTAAIAEWNRALRLDPSDAKAHYGLALALHNQGQLPAALAEYRKSLDLDSENATTHTNYGAALVAIGKLDEGIDTRSPSRSSGRRRANRSPRARNRYNPEQRRPDAAAERHTRPTRRSSK